MGSFLDDVSLAPAGSMPSSFVELDPHMAVLVSVSLEAVADASWVPGTAINGQPCVFTAADASLFAVPLTSFAVPRILASALSADTQQLGNIDAACSSGYLTVQRGAEQISNGQCEAAVVAGVQLLLMPRYQSDITSKNGVMRPLDVSACPVALACTCAVMT